MNKQEILVMMHSAWIWTTLAVLTTAIFLFYAFVRENKNKKLPPGPRGLPIVGHLHLLGKNPHRDLQKLSEQHGPIMHLRFGFVSNIIVSSPHAAKQFLKTHDLVFASRPPMEAAKYLSFGQRTFSFSQYGPYWRVARKLCTLSFLSGLKISSFQSIRKQDIGLVVDSLKRAALNRDIVNVSAEVGSLIANLSCLMVFGKKYANEDVDARGFKRLFREGAKLGAAFNLGDYFPFLGVLDLQSLTRKMKALSKVFDDFFEKIIVEHEQFALQVREADDFVYTLLGLMKSGEIEFQFDRLHIKAILLDMLAGSIDTSSTTIDWTLSELLKNPRTMKIVQQELDEVVGTDRMVEESDLDSLKYLDMVVKEALRLHAVVPLLLPHCATEDCSVEGYHIPKDSRVIINAWAIGRDPKAWPDPEKFIPERFSGSNIDVRGQDFELLPFGSGRRGCPGIQLALTLVHLVVAKLVHCFSWELPNGMMPEELDMTEEFGMVTTRTKHLLAIPIYRLSK